MIPPPPDLPEEPGWSPRRDPGGLDVGQVLMGLAMLTLGLAAAYVGYQGIRRGLSGEGDTEEP